MVPRYMLPDITCDICSTIYVATADKCPKCFPWEPTPGFDYVKQYQEIVGYFRTWGTAGE
jgi:hypothetical protein